MMNMTKNDFMTIRLKGPLKRKLKRRSALHKRTLINEVVVVIERGLQVLEAEELEARSRPA